MISNPPRSRPLALLVLFTFLAACSPGKQSPYGEGGGSKSKEKKPAPPTVVMVTHPGTKDLEEMLDVTGEVIALRKTDILPQVGGVAISGLEVELGDPVTPETVLARLETTDLQQAADEAEAARAEAEARVKEARLTESEIGQQMLGQVINIEHKRLILERSKEEAKGGALSQRLLLDAEFEWQREKAALEQLKAQKAKAAASVKTAEAALTRAEHTKTKALRDVKRCLIHAPYPGIISARMANPGQLTNQSQALYSIFDPKTLIVEVHVPQRLLARITTGQKVILQPRTLGAEELEGSVTTISPVVNRETGTLPIRITPKSRGNLRPGQFLSGRIVLETHPAQMVVPRKSVESERENPFVFVVTPKDEAADENGYLHGVVRRHFFSQGIFQDDVVQYLPQGEEKLGRDQLIVLVGIDRLREGDAVRYLTPGSESTGG